MKLVTTLLAAAVVAVMAIMFDRRHRSRVDRRFDRRFDRRDLDGPVGSDLGDPGISADEDVVDAEIIAGIADVDPEPLSQVSGEGIDPDATEAAHTQIQEQRDRLPRGGKNVP